MQGGNNMCGIMLKSGFHTETDIDKFSRSLKLLKSRGPDEFGLYFGPKYAVGTQRLVVIDKINGKQPLTYLNKHFIYNGEVYNTEILKEKLKNDGVEVLGYGDTEIVLKYFSTYGYESLNDLRGMFSFCLASDEEIIAVRDQLGIKPLYYSIFNNDVIIASEIKAILEYSKKAVVTKRGLKELLGLSPAFRLGTTIYEDIYEVPPGHYLHFDRINGLSITKYYTLKAQKYDKTFEECVNDVKKLVTDSVHQQLISDVSCCTFLSGGLDSTIITAIAKKKISQLETYSIEYEGNKQSFIANDFQTSSDIKTIPNVVSYYNLNHHYEEVSLNNLVDMLKTAVILRDGPGMADVDASLFYLAKSIKKRHTVALSGEGADEIFGGYPWFYKHTDYKTFPWFREYEMRESLINPNLIDSLNLSKYLEDTYHMISSNVDYLEDDSDVMKNHRLMTCLNLYNFMPNLAVRKDRMTMGASLEARLPFLNLDLVEYMYNVPFSYKFYNNMEKGLLREAFKDELIEEVYLRKKNPYPKTHDKRYENLIIELLNPILLDDSSILHTLFSIDKIKKLMASSENNIPWFGQLMTKPQLLAFLYQIDFWFKEYKIELRLD